MIRDPMGIIAVLLVIEGVVLYVAELPRLATLFRYVPFMFWIYFLPMLANTLGLIPPERGAADRLITPVYGTITRYCLPACLVLLLVNVDLRRIWRLGPVALAAMLAGSVGIVVGGPIIQLLFGRWLPPDIWTGLGALSASWVGGSANLVAVSHSLKTPPDILGMMIVVDSIVPYAWMGLLILLSARQGGFDRWNRSRVDILDDLRRRAGEGTAITHPITLRHVVLMFSVAAAATCAAGWMSDWLAAWLTQRAAAGRLGWLAGIELILNTGTLAIILATTMGLVLSFTPVRRLERFGASTVGYGLLYFVLASIGAKTSLARLGGAPVMVLAGVVWVLIHAAFLLAAGRLLRAPMALLATASQANIGGTASAPVVAGVYQPGLAPVGLLLAVLGNIIGTYTGIACAAMCRAVGQW
jgi:uncharacterized membrane protein